MTVLRLPLRLALAIARERLGPHGQRTIIGRGAKQLNVLTVQRVSGFKAGAAGQRGFVMTAIAEAISVAAILFAFVVQHDLEERIRQRVKPHSGILFGDQVHQDEGREG